MREVNTGKVRRQSSPHDGAESTEISGAMIASAKTRDASEKFTKTTLYNDITTGTDTAMWSWKLYIE